MQCDYPYPCSRSIGPFPIDNDALRAECLHLGWKYLSEQVQAEGAWVWLVAWVIKLSNKFVANDYASLLFGPSSYRIRSSVNTIHRHGPLVFIYVADTRIQLVQ